MIGEATGVIAPIFENIPEVLTKRRQWVTWRLEERDGRLTKIPFTPESGRRASVSDLMTWTTFERAVEAYERPEPHYHGLGYCFCSGDRFVGLDLDGCRNLDSGEIAPWAQKILSRVHEAHIEISPRGLGLHVIMEGIVPGGGMRRGSIELYSQSRFFCMTGALL